MGLQNTFIDLCAGCGGLSLGLIKAGWQGIFAIEKNSDAFATLRHNLLNPELSNFNWPNWLKVAPHSLEDITTKHQDDAISLRGKVELLTGGPPCQGFSMSGRRDSQDPRNQLFRQYLKVVELLQPNMVLMENVRGILYPFKDENALRDSQGKPIAYGQLIKSYLSADYHVWSGIVHAGDFGVPQNRPRFILIGLRKNNYQSRSFDSNPLSILYQGRQAFLGSKGLDVAPTTVRQAISDLTKQDNLIEDCHEKSRLQARKIRKTGVKLPATYAR